MACRGAQVIELLIERERLDSKKLPRNGKDPYLWEHHDPDLEIAVCQNCPFFAHDCDFQSKNQLPGAEPCGGYILLCLLKENGSIIIGDLEKTTGE
ncbi:MAG: hypothetical protein ACMUIU_18345 [bacterium]